VFLWNRYVNHHVNSWIDNLESCKIVDAGMGFGRLGFAIKLDHPHKAIEIYGYDSYQPALDYAKSLGYAYETMNKLDIGKSKLPHNDKSIDIGIASGVLAHLEKNEGNHLLSELERISKHHIVTAPTTLHSHKKSLCNDPDIEPLRHKSSWIYKDFVTRGYNVRGFGIKGREKQTTFDSIITPYIFSLSAVNQRFCALAGTIVAWK
jgi:2-polyprenyl-3-methyl-5-hydroxy-6-metoxy-1,4-benzoquinol methylase|tara:strand:- start:1792 stop:2409 length:618 start_codon:yes stop_codon:yes gene_type:complete